MVTTHKTLTDLTASDLMAREVVRLAEDMPLREAVRLLLEKQISGAPVVDADGKCVGVFSTTDFLRLGAKRDDITKAAGPPLPVTCSFQIKQTMPSGREVVLCLLPPGACPIQVKEKEKEPGDKELLVCGQPHCVLVDWQVVELEQLPMDGIRDFMTTDPVTVRPDTPVRALARLMIDAHIHRVIVVDEDSRPLGVVASTDLLAALAYGGHEESGPP